MKPLWQSPLGPLSGAVSIVFESSLWGCPWSGFYHCISTFGARELVGGMCWRYISLACSHSAWSSLHPEWLHATQYQGASCIPLHTRAMEETNCPTPTAKPSSSSRDSPLGDPSCWPRQQPCHSHLSKPYRLKPAAIRLLLNGSLGAILHLFE